MHSGLLKEKNIYYKNEVNKMNKEELIDKILETLQQMILEEFKKKEEQNGE